MSEVVDLTLSSREASSDGELVVRSTAPEPIDYRNGDSGRMGGFSGWEPSVRIPRTRTPPMSERLAQDGSQHPDVSRDATHRLTTTSPKRTPRASPVNVMPASSQVEATPTNSARVWREESAISQPRPQSSRSTRSNPQNFTPQPTQRMTRAAHQTPKSQTPKRMDWTMDKMASKLNTFVDEVTHGHSKLVEFLLEEAEKKAPQQRHVSSIDDFADMKSAALDGPPDAGMQTMSAKFKQHSGEAGKSKGAPRRLTYPVACIKTDKEAVPKYRFHHVEIRKNILTPNTMLRFVPHLRDVDPGSVEEKKYSNWLTELEKLDSQSGFKVQDRVQKVAKRQRDEFAATLSMYLEPWLRTLGIYDSSTKSILIRYMASQPENEKAMTQQQKQSILDAYGNEPLSPSAAREAKTFTDAFDRVFNHELRVTRVQLRDILLLDKSLETVMDNKRVKETPSSQKERNKDLVPKVETILGSYGILGCQICFGHDCEHGEFNTENERGAFSLESTGGLTRTLRERWLAQVEAAKNNPQQQNGLMPKPAHPACENQCYRQYDIGNPAHPLAPWSETEVQVLESAFATVGFSATLKPQCFVAAVLGRKCWDVYRKLKEMNLSLPRMEPRAELPRVKQVPWYDRKKKQLMGDWSDYTVSHEHSLRELTEPCKHDGPCTVANACPCAKARPHTVLCERFCHCTADECAIKFTGCACHSTGKTCVQRQREGKACICIMLNRECDPVLCQGCGARERADPENMHDDHLHSTGCQNVSLQRGNQKAVLLGKSQLDGCGYGLFTAEDVAQDEFIIEYTGEIITHDEGVRREARRGDVFDEESNSSYLFTLLEQEGIWVDAAIYGNLSRYINHASESDRKGCNITPKILYVNGEYRIKFTALRDIKAGEELFFNYGDNFPNLTKKLLDKDEEGQDDGAGGKKRKGGGRIRQNEAAARKTTSKVKAKEPDLAPPGKNGRSRPRRDLLSGLGEDDAMGWMGGLAADDEDIDDWAEERTPKRKKNNKRGGARPGAGRKKKSHHLQQQQQQQQQQAAAAAAAIAAAIPPAEVNGSRPTTAISGVGGIQEVETPSRRSKRSSATMSRLGPDIIAAAAGSPVGGGLLYDGGQSTPEQANGEVKKVSKRGGARPGAGRKPKHKNKKVRLSTSNSNVDGDSSTAGAKDSGATTTQTTGVSLGTDSDDTPLMKLSTSFRADAPERTPLPTAGSSANTGGEKNKRKAVVMDSDLSDSDAFWEDRELDRSLEQSREEIQAAPAQMTSGTATFRQDRFQPILSDEIPSPLSAISGGTVVSHEGEDDDESVVNRSLRRQRQKPLRYREEQDD